MRIIEIDRLQLDYKTRLRGREILIKSTQSNTKNLVMREKEKNTLVPGKGISNYNKFRIQ